MVSQSVSQILMKQLVQSWIYETKDSLAKGTTNLPNTPAGPTRDNTIPQAQIMKSIPNAVTKRSD